MSPQIAGLLVGRPIHHTETDASATLMPAILRALRDLYRPDGGLFYCQKSDDGNNHAVPILFVDERRSTRHVMINVRRQYGADKPGARYGAGQAQQMAREFREVRDTGAAILILETYLSMAAGVQKQ